MSKRKLSRQQAWRVSKIQEDRRQRAAKHDAESAAALASGELGPEQDGLIIAHYGTQVEVEAAGVSQRCHLRANLGGLVTGDRVVWCAGDPLGVVVARQSRQSELLRPDPYGDLKAMAANIDQIIVVIAPLPEPHAKQIDRYLVAAEEVSIQALILLNKNDLLDSEQVSLMDDLLAPYPDLGYPLLSASSKTQQGLAELMQALSGHTSIFIGQSGVGKSSLVNALLPEAELRVGELSQTRQEGTHTTTTARLFHLESGGTLIDSPGIREFGLWHMEREQVENGFREFQALLGHCKFRDCRHLQEPGCALIEASQTGAVSRRRLASYRDIIDSLQDKL
ncbi:MAG: small ribosomal subunit biogenesis GTPase RsgA [Gammaproteobacteria bacterium]|nr:small ribosomal subunit biogenesis GTPase RsgA [Gammaproteobacteria bacterium]